MPGHADSDSAVERRGRDAMLVILTGAAGAGRFPSGSFGNLYHLNAEEEPELPDYPNPKDFPHFRERFGPRGVMHSWRPIPTTPPKSRAGAG